MTSALRIGWSCGIGRIGRPASQADGQGVIPAGVLDIVDQPVAVESADAIQLLACFQIALGDGGDLAHRRSGGRDGGVTEQDDPGDTEVFSARLNRSHGT